jgi:phospholipase C
MRQFLSLLMVEMLVGGLLLQPVTAQAQNAPAFGTTTPIQHLVVIFQENVSFDHYFGTYPNAMNPQGQPKFTPVAGTPDVNGLTGAMVTNNPNVNAANGAGSTNPFRLDRSQAATSDQNHNYTPEITALHGGLVDLYPSSVGVAGTVTNNLTPGIFGTTGINLGYYDGNTVTALWNYAQHYAMSDNSYDTNFGPSTPGAINLVSGQTNGAVGNINGTASVVTSNPDGSTTIIGDADPLGDVCSTTTGELYSLTGQTIGDLLNAKGITWGFYTQGFDLGVTNANGTTGCKRSTTSLITNTNKADYIPHHEPFQYYKSTQNLTHARPTSVTSVGSTDAANHQYDVHDFYDAINSGNFPAVNFLKAPGYQDGHAGYSDPLDEQTFIVNVINFLQGTSYWNNTAVVIMYDDSDGWYDHQMPPIMNQSNSSADNGACGTGTNALPGPNGVAHAQGRCGYGPRLPMLVISPYSKANFVDHTVTDQTSVIRFVEDNWLNGQRIGNGSFDTIANSIANMFDFTKMQAKGKLVLDPTTGLVTNGAKAAK